MTVTEKLWQSMDSDETGYISHKDVARVVKKYKKTLPERVVLGLEEAVKDTVRISKKYVTNYRTFYETAWLVSMAYQVTF